MVDNTSGKFPTGQRTRGTPSAEKKNPKAENLRNSIGGKGDGMGGIRPGPKDDGDEDTFSGWGELGERGNPKDSGSPASIPDPGKINPTYAPNGPGVPATTTTSANRSYSIDPGKQDLASTSGVVDSEQRETPRGGGD